MLSKKKSVKIMVLMQIFSKVVDFYKILTSPLASSHHSTSKYILLYYFGSRIFEIYKPSKIHENPDFRPALIKYLSKLWW